MNVNVSIRFHDMDKSSMNILPNILFSQNRTVIPSWNDMKLSKWRQFSFLVTTLLRLRKCPRQREGKNEQDKSEKREKMRAHCALEH